MPIKESAAQLQDEKVSLKPELRKLWNYRFKLVAVSLITGILAFAYVTLKKVEYLTTAEITPPSLKHVKSLNFSKSHYQGFGTADDEDLERLTAALKSDTAFQFIAQKFNLAEHYGVGKIDFPKNQLKTTSNESDFVVPSEIGSQMKVLREMYDDKVSIKVSGFSTVQINVFDHNPQIAAAIANELVDYSQRFVENIARRKEGIEEIKKTLAIFQEKLTILEDSVANYRKNYRLYHLDNMSEAISAQVTASFVNPKFSEKYDKLLSAEHRMRYYDDNIITMQNEVAFRIENLNTYPTLVDVISRGFPSYVRARPKRLPYMAVSVLVVFAISCLIVLYVLPNNPKESRN